VLLRSLLVGVASLAACAATASPSSGAESAVTVLTCTNLASGASWQIKIDFKGGTVDSNPARITSTTISWHDRTDGGNYTLDRKSGSLEVVFASSTGGYFIHDRCRRP
jgi:hypothetical protein